MKPSLGRIVLYHSPEEHNASKVHPAMITRVWSDTCVNLMVFFDAGTSSPRTSVVLDEDNKQDYGWCWPPKV